MDQRAGMDLRLWVVTEREKRNYRDHQNGQRDQEFDSLAHSWVFRLHEWSQKREADQVLGRTFQRQANKSMPTMVQATTAQTPASQP